MGSPGSDAGSDAEHIEASLQDPQRFSVLFERHAAPVHRFLARRAAPGTVDDLLSETFVTAFRTRQNYDLTYGDARPWFFGMAVNVVRHHHRSEARRTAMVGRVVQRATPDQTMPDAADDALAHVESENRVEGMVAALRAIDSRYLDVLLLISGPQLSYEEMRGRSRSPSAPSAPGCPAEGRNCGNCYRSQGNTSMTRSPPHHWRSRNDR